MIRYSALLGLAAVFIFIGDAKAQALLATTPVVVDARESGSAPGTLGAIPALVQPAAPPATALPPTGNPLWAVPLKSLSVTRERPLFSPSRRAPAPPVLAAAYTVPAPSPSKPAIRAFAKDCAHIASTRCLISRITGPSASVHSWAHLPAAGTSCCYGRFSSSAMTAFMRL